MNTFFKTFFACLLAIVISSVLNFFFWFLIVSVMISSALSSEETYALRPSSILKIDLGVTMVESSAQSPFESIDFESMKFNKQISIYDVVSLIEAAKSDPNIDGILVNVPMVNANSTSTLYELRDALVKFKSGSSKFIIAYGDVYSQGGYYVASCADKIYLNPQGAFQWSGMSATSMFFKGTLDKLGIEPEIIRHGKFKGAVEMFMLDKMSAENREQTQSLIGSIWNYSVEKIAESRQINADTLQQYATNLTIQTPQDALKYSLVDSLFYTDQLIEELSRLTSQDKPRFATLSQYKSVNQTVGRGNLLASESVAVIYASGEIMDGGKSAGAIIGNILAQDIRNVRKDSSVKAVVLRVNSPGGSVLASDIIWREVELTRQVKPVVVSMGAAAASGGYYISCPADEIIATPTTITGSIGVFGVLFNAEKAAREKLGVTVDIVQTNPNADMGNMFRPLTAFQRQVIQNSVDSTYTRFVGLVAQGRDIPFEKVDDMAQGRVWSGLQALDNGLVDKIGTLQDAVHSAAQRAAVSEYRVDFYPKADESLSALMEILAQSSVRLIKSAMGVVPQAVDQAAETMKKHEGVKARMPFDIEIQ